MTALCSAQIQQYAKDAAKTSYSGVNSGILGDTDHYDSNSYHIPVHHLPNRGGYTNYWPNDKVPPAENDHVTGIDTSMSTNDMIAEWNRYLAVFNNTNDPRRKFIAEYIGWNGKGEAERLDFGDGSRDIADSSHKWHSHEGIWRKYYASADAFKAALSIRKGETPDQYLNSIGQGPALASGRAEMFAVVQVGTGAEVWEARGGKLYQVSSQEKVHRLINLGANCYYASGVYGGKGGFKSKEEMVDTCGPIDVPETTK
jgi:hypothetical protein